MKNKITNLIIVIFLIGIGFYNRLLYLRSEESSVLNLVSRGDAANITLSRPGELLAGETMSGVLHSMYPNLGIVSIRFYNMDRDSNDKIIFRIKKVGDKNWYYQATYNTDQFLPHKLFPFGFPVINNSANTDFYFEIESLEGKVGQGITVDPQSPIFVGKSQFTKSELLQDKKKLGYFILNKAINLIDSSEGNSINLVFFLPLTLYICYLLFSKSGYQPASIVTIVLIIYETYLLKQPYLIYFLATLSYWVVTSFKFGITPRVSILYSTFMTLATVLFIGIGQPILAEKTAIWVGCFMVATVLIRILEIIFPDRFTLSERSYLVGLRKIKFDQPISQESGQSIIGRLATYLVCLLIVFSTFVRIYRTIPVFRIFYPDVYVSKYLFSLLLPETILAILVAILFFKIKKRTKSGYIVAVLVTAIFYLTSNWLISNMTEFKDSPSLLKVNPPSVSEAWTDVVLTGKNFRDKPFVGKVYIDDSEQLVVLYWSDDKIIFRTNPEKTKSGKLFVAPQDRNITNSIPFVYTFRK